jgi:hypothetical protein
MTELTNRKPPLPDQVVDASDIGPEDAGDTGGTPDDITVIGV